MCVQYVIKDANVAVYKRSKDKVTIVVFSATTTDELSFELGMQNAARLKEELIKYVSNL